MFSGPSRADNFNGVIIKQIIKVIKMPNIKIEDYIGYWYCFKNPKIELLKELKYSTFKEEVIQVLNAGIDVGYHTDCTGIRGYIVDNNIEMVKLILDNVTERNYKVTELSDVRPLISILSLAAKMGRKEIVDIILESDHIKYENENIYNKDKYSAIEEALIYALAYGHPVIANKLESIVVGLRKTKFDKNDKEYKLWKQNILFSAVASLKTVKALELLHKITKDLGLDNEYIKNKLDMNRAFIIELSYYEDTSDTLRYYIEKLGANVNKKRVDRKKERTALCFAVMYTNYKGVKILLENGAGVNLRSDNIKEFWNNCPTNNLDSRKENNNKIIKLVESYVK